MRTLTVADHGFAAASNCIGRAARTLCAALRAQIDDTRTLDAVMASRGAALLQGAPYGSAMASARYRKLDALSYCASAPCSTRSRIVLQGGDSASTSSRAMTVQKAVGLMPSDGRYGITSTPQLPSELERHWCMNQSSG